MNILEKYLPEIDKELKSIIRGSKSAQEMYDMMAYFLGWQDEFGRKIDDKNARGKRFRPTLCLLCCEALGGDYKKALSVAATIELFHNFSLIHDDIEDHDEVRRHKPSLWKLWGIEKAINTGDAMFILSELSGFNLKIESRKKLKILETLNQAFLEITEGQFIDMNFEKSTKVKIANYLEMIDKKTASLVSASAGVGAIIGTDNLKIIKNFKDFGFNFGMAYQIYDDIAGIWGKKNETGKEVAGDIKKKKKTLPLIYSLEKFDLKKRNQVIKIYKKDKLSDLDIKLVTNLLNKTESKEYTAKLVKDYQKKAVSCLEKIKMKDEIKAEIQDLVSSLID